MSDDADTGIVDGINTPAKMISDVSKVRNDEKVCLIKDLNLNYYYQSLTLIILTRKLVLIAESYFMNTND